MAALLAPLSLACGHVSGSQGDATAGMTQLQLDVDGLSAIMKAADFDARPPGGGRRIGITGTDAAGVAGETLSQPASSTAAAIEEQFYALTNADRQAAGVAGLTRGASLDSYARAQAAALANAGALSHSDISQLLGTWWIVGENVGYGPDAQTIQTAYRNSPGHYENIVEPSFTSIGVGVSVDANGRVWTAQEYGG
jgi:uncharacterized protein YkwD